MVLEYHLPLYLFKSPDFKYGRYLFSSTYNRKMFEKVFDRNSHCLSTKKPGDIINIHGDTRYQEQIRNAIKE
jgi:hypothetical protein